MDQCAICLAGLSPHSAERVALPCGHVFHASCVDGIVEHGGHRCPLCRVPFREEQDSYETPNRIAQEEMLLAAYLDRIQHLLSEQAPHSTERRNARRSSGGVMPCGRTSRRAMHGYMMDTCQGFGCWCLDEVDFTQCFCCSDLRRARAEATRTTPAL